MFVGVVVFVGVTVCVGVTVGVEVFDAVGVGVTSPRQVTQLSHGPLNIVVVNAKGVSNPSTIE